MMKLDTRGAAALEFCLVGGTFFIVMFAIFDFGRYAITVQSLRMLADAGARAMMVSCYIPQDIKQTTSDPKASPSGCTGDPLSVTAKKNAAPFLFAGGLTPTVVVTKNGSSLVVTASQPNFKMIMPTVWKSLNAPSVSTTVPYH